MKSMERIFDKSKIRFKNDNNRKFEYEKFARACTKSSNRAVKQQMEGLIPLNKEEIETLIMSFPESHIWYKENAEMLDNCLSEAYDHKVGVIKMNPTDIEVVVNLLDTVADSSEHIHLLNSIIHWYGFKRQNIRPDVDFIPQDVGRGNYDEDEYCGTTAKEFLFQEAIVVEDEEKLDLINLNEDYEDIESLYTQECEIDLIKHETYQAFLNNKV